MPDGSNLESDGNDSREEPPRGDAGTRKPPDEERPLAAVLKEKRPKVAFVSRHCVLDPTNGAATATLDGLALLARSGFACQAFCSSHMDACEELPLDELLARRRLLYAARYAQLGPYRRRMIHTSHGAVAVTLFHAASTRGWVSDEEIAAFLTGCEIFLTRSRADAVWTYGGDAVSLALQKLVRRLDIPLLFALHNFNYRNRTIFAATDHVVVPTEFARRFYRETIGLECRVLPLVMDAERVRVDNGPHPGPLPGVEENGKSEISNLGEEKVTATKSRHIAKNA